MSGSIFTVLAMLERREIITTNPAEADKCCGMERDDDGFCEHRPHHQIYVPISTATHMQPVEAVMIPQWAAEMVVDRNARLCNVCTGHSPSWDGHDTNPPCRGAAYDEIHKALAWNKR